MKNSKKKDIQSHSINTVLSAVEWREIVDFPDYEVSNFGNQTIKNCLSNP